MKYNETPLQETTNVKNTSGIVILFLVIQFNKNKYFFLKIDCCNFICK